jgi:hypothetical protein
MNKILLGLILGVAAGAVDIAPMLLQRLPVAAIASAAAQWLFLGVVISACELGLPGWATGMALGLAGAVPVIIVAVANPELTPKGEEAKTALVMALMSLALGAGVGALSRLWGRA